MEQNRTEIIKKFVNLHEEVIRPKDCFSTTYPGQKIKYLNDKEIQLTDELIRLIVPSGVFGRVHLEFLPETEESYLIKCLSRDRADGTNRYLSLKDALEYFMYTTQEIPEFKIL